MSYPVVNICCLTALTPLVFNFLSYAPGVNIVSAGITSVTATAIMSGTSMSTPQVAAIVACAISEHGNTDPATMSADLIAAAGVVNIGSPSFVAHLF